MSLQRSYIGPQRSYIGIGPPILILGDHTHTQNLTNLGNSVTSELLFKLLGHTVEALSYTNIFFITAFTFSHLKKKEKKKS